MPFTRTVGPSTGRTQYRGAAGCPSRGSRSFARGDAELVEELHVARVLGIADGQEARAEEDRIGAGQVAQRLGLVRERLAPGRKPEAIKARLAEQIAALLDASDRFDPDRLSQEAVMIAAKADIREELDRIASHISQAREMIGKGGAIGRRLDFLAQEFNREVNTCCSKSNDIELTNTGLAMKNVVEQFREQVQNLE